MATPVALKDLSSISVLGRIVARKVTEVNAMATPSTPSSSDRSFEGALAQTGLRLIAEVKRKSPSRGAIRPDVDLDTLAAIYDRHADAISVLTDAEDFGGSLETLERIRSLTNKPVLQKDFIVSEAQILAGRHHGADAVLLMTSILPTDSLRTLLELVDDLNMSALVEVHDELEAEAALAVDAAIVGVNNRDLHTLEIDLANYHRIAPRLIGRLRVCESGLVCRADVDAVRESADAALIGTGIMSAPDIERAIESLGW